jgi:HK97 family phage prohead protease
VVGATIGHDYEQELGRTDRGTLCIHINDRGLFFKIIPDSPLAWDAYRKVKKNQIRHCSLSFKVKQERDFKEEQRAAELFELLNWKEKIIVQDYKMIKVFEVCICNSPANKDTWCTTNKNDPRLKGIQWESDSK